MEREVFPVSQEEMLMSLFISENAPYRCDRGEPGKLGCLFRAGALVALWICCLFTFACGGGSSSQTTFHTPTPTPIPIPNPVAPGPAGQGIAPDYFGLDIFDTVLPSFGNHPWPTFPFGAVRLWDSHTSWLQIDGGPTANPEYDFSILDSWLQLAQQHRQNEVMYTFGQVPVWASSNPNDLTCQHGSWPAGSCDAPSDVAPDGSGTDQIWQNFVTAIVNHNNQSATAHITAWEIWNEPTIPAEWNGTVQQLARMAQDACKIIRASDPSALITTPTPVPTAGLPAAAWMTQYIATAQVFSSSQCPAPAADVITFHGYLSAAGVTQPEKIIDTVAGMISTLSTTGLTNLPIWDTESDWGKNSDLPDPDLEAAFLARFFLLQYSTGAARLYWYQYGNTGFGSLLVNGTLNSAGIAYQQVYDWMVGATLTSPCSQTGSVWTCHFTKPGGLQELAVWDASQTCSNGNCTTSGYTPDSVYVKFADLAGNAFSFTAGTSVQIGAKPILLLNQ